MGAPPPCPLVFVSALDFVRLFYLVPKCYAEEFVVSHPMSPGFCIGTGLGSSVSSGAEMPRRGAFEVPHPYVPRSFIYFYFEL